MAIPRETTLKQLKMLRKLTKGTDIGDLTSNDRLNKTPNLQSIGNPVDTGIDTYEDFAKKDSKIQTIAFKSKTVNKSINKKNNITEMKDINLLNFDDFDKNSKKDKLNKIIKENNDKTLNFDTFFNINEKNIDNDIKAEPILDDIEDEKEIYDEVTSDIVDGTNTPTENEIEGDIDDFEIDFDINGDVKKFSDLDKEEVAEELEEDEELEELEEENEDDVITFEKFSLKEISKKEEKQPKYEILGEEKEQESSPLFGVAIPKDKENNRITKFNMIDPTTPKERSILNAGQFIDNGKVKGFINRIEGKDVYIESTDHPLEHIKVSIKDIL